MTQGWALKSNKSRSSSNEKQKDFLNRIYEEGKKTDMKANPENVAKTMTGILQNEDNERVFQLSDFLTPQQVASYFSRMPSLQKKMSPFNDE